MAQPVAQDHRLLKGIVIALGLLILLGFGALIFGLVTKGGKKAPPARLTAPAPLIIPKDAQIQGMALSERQLALRVTEGGREEILLVDLQSGKITERISVARE